LIIKINITTNNNTIINIHIIASPILPDEGGFFKLLLSFTGEGITVIGGEVPTFTDSVGAIDLLLGGGNCTIGDSGALIFL